MKYEETELPLFLKRILSEGAKTYATKSGLRIIYSVDKTEKGKLKHMSISHPDRYPTWNEIVMAKIRFMGDMTDGMMIIPKRHDYVNISENCFHVWETPTCWGIR